MKTNVIRNSLLTFKVKKISLSKEDLLLDLKHYLFLKSHGYSDEKCFELLNINGNNFNTLEKKYLQLKSYLSNNDYYCFIYNIEKNSNNTTKYLTKNLLYPVFLNVLLILISVFFNLIIIPNYINIASSLKENINDFGLIRSILRGFYLLSIILIIIILILFILLKNKRIKYKIYKKLTMIKNNNIFNLSVSLKFSRYYSSLLNISNSSFNIFDCLVKVNDIFVRNIALYMKKDAEKGKKFNETIENTLLISSLKETFKIGYSTGELLKMLNEFSEITELILMRRIKTIISIYTYSIYTITGIMICIFYKVIMFPLSIIQLI